MGYDKRVRELILAIFYPSLKYIVGCFGLFLQAKKVNIYFTELAERVEYGNYGTLCRASGVELNAHSFGTQKVIPTPDFRISPGGRKH